MINANFISKVGNVYNFGVAVAATPVLCIFDRPIKKIRTISEVTLSDDIVTYEAGSIVEFPSIYGYPVQLNLEAAADDEFIIEVIEYGDKPAFNYWDEYEPIQFKLVPVAGTETVLGKLISTVQTDVAVDEASGRITGELAYIEDWTQYSAVDNTGNFIALAIDSAALASFSIHKASTPEKVVVFDEDMTVVVKITDLNDEIVIDAIDSGITTRKIYPIRDLILMQQEV